MTVREINSDLPNRRADQKETFLASVTSEMARTFCFFGYVVFATALGPEAIKQTQSTAKYAYPPSGFFCTILAKAERYA